MEDRDWTALYSVSVGEEGAEENRDLGDIIARTLRATPLTVRILLKCKEIAWNVHVNIPSNRRVEIIGANYIHCYINEKSGGSQGSEEDNARCPVRIVMKEAHLVYPDRKEGESFYNHVIYGRARLSNCAYLLVKGVTIIETSISCHPTSTVYEEGVFVISGPFGSVEVIDSRIELSRGALVAGHAAGISHVNLGHLRFVGQTATGGEGTRAIHPVIATRGQSWSGHECNVSVTDVVLEGDVSWAGECLEGPFRLRYLSDVNTQ